MGIQVATDLTGGRVQVVMRVMGMVVSTGEASLAYSLLRGLGTLVLDGLLKVLLGFFFFFISSHINFIRFSLVL